MGMESSNTTSSDTSPSGNAPVPPIHLRAGGKACSPRRRAEKPNHPGWMYLALLAGWMLQGLLLVLSRHFPAESALVKVPLLLLAPGILLIGWAAWIGGSRPIGGTPWGKPPAGAGGEAGSGGWKGLGWMLGKNPAGISPSRMARRRRWLAATIRRRTRFPARMAFVNLLGIGAILVLIFFLPVPKLCVFPSLMLLALGAAVALGNLFEGPLLEALGGRARLDLRGRCLHGLAHLAAAIMAAPIAGMLTISFLQYILSELPEEPFFSRSAILIAGPLVWQTIRIGIGFLLAAFTLARGPLELVHAARTDKPAVSAPPSGSLSPKASWIGAAITVVILLPALWDIPSREWDYSLFLAVLLMLLEVGVACSVAVAVFLRRAVSVPSAPPRFSWHSLGRLLLPWVVLGILFLLLPNEKHFLFNENNYKGFSIYFVSFGIGMLLAAAVGWVVGMRYSTLSLALCIGLWVSVAFSALLHFGAIAGLHQAELSLAAVGVSYRNLVSAQVTALLQRLVAFSSLRGAQLVLFFLVLRWIRARERLPESPAPARRFWGGAGLDVWRHRKDNPIIRRSLHLSPYGGHRFWNLLRIGLYFSAALLIFGIVEMMIRGTNPHQTPMLAYLMGISVFWGVLAQGAFAGSLGVRMGYKLRETGERMDLHMSLLGGEAIVSGKLLVALLQTAVWTFLPALVTFLPMTVTMDEWDDLFPVSLFGLFIAIMVLWSTNNAAQGMWMGLRWRSPIAAELVIAVQSILFSFFTLVVATMAAVWVHENLSAWPESGRIFWGAVLGTLLMLLPRLCVGDYYARRVADDFVGAAEEARKAHKSLHSSEKKN